METNNTVDCNFIITKHHDNATMFDLAFQKVLRNKKQKAIA